MAAEVPWLGDKAMRNVNEFCLWSYGHEITLQFKFTFKLTLLQSKLCGFFNIINTYLQSLYAWHFDKQICSGFQNSICQLQGAFDQLTEKGNHKITIVIAMNIYCMLKCFKCISSHIQKYYTLFSCFHKGKTLRGWG